MGSIYGYELESELPLRRLHATPGVRGCLRVEGGAQGLLDQSAELTAWLDWPGTDERFALARSDGSLIVWWSEIGAFEIDPARGRIRAEALRLDELVEHRLATTVIPLLLAERGDLVLHGSVVAVDGRAVLFCGPSGCGKSTLALQASRLGHAVLSEDGAVIEPGDAKVWPGARGIFVEDAPTIAARARAKSDSGGPAVFRRGRDLRLLAPELEASGPAPVAAICRVGGRGPELSVARLPAAEAVPVLVPDLLHGGGPGSLRPAFSLLIGLLALVPVYRVSLPDGLSRAPAATRSVLDEVAG